MAVVAFKAGKVNNYRLVGGFFRLIRLCPTTAVAGFAGVAVLGRNTFVKYLAFAGGVLAADFVIVFVTRVY